MTAKRVLTVEGARTDEFLAVFDHLGVTLDFVSSKHALAKVGRVDGVLLMGGRDISPALYGARRNPHTQLSDPYRDGLEYALAKTALASDTPVLGICRGLQMMTAVGGGTLTQHLHSPGHRSGSHRLKWARGRLATLLPRLEVNSFHHQAVDRPPRGFEVVAEAPDGVIEAVYRPGALGLQWHLESLAVADDRWLSLFEWFLEGLQPCAYPRH